MKRHLGTAALTAVFIVGFFSAQALIAPVEAPFDAYDAAISQSLESTCRPGRVTRDADGQWLCTYTNADGATIARPAFGHSKGKA